MVSKARRVIDLAETVEQKIPKLTWEEVASHIRYITPFRQQSPTLSEYSELRHVIQLQTLLNEQYIAH